MTKEKKRKRKNKIKEKEKRIIKTAWRKANIFWLSNTISKRESITVKFQEECEVSYCILSKIPIIVKPPTFMKDMTPGFNRIVITWILKFFSFLLTKLKKKWSEKMSDKQKPGVNS